MVQSPKFHFIKEFCNPEFGTPIPCGNSLLHQVGELYCGGMQDIKEHNQWCYEFTYVLEGKGIIYTNGVPSPVKQYDCHWASMNDKHRIVSDRGSPLRFIFLGYTSKNPEICDIHSMLFEGNNKLGDGARVFSDMQLKEEFLKILPEIENDNPFALHLIDSFIKIIVIKSFRFLSNSDTIAHSPKRKDPSLIVYQVSNYIDQNILKIKSLAELENSLNYNYRYLARIFLNVMGITLKEYFRRKKMEKAAELLISPDMTVTKAAELLNYSCIHAFSRAFEGFFGVSPSKYAKA